MRAYPALARAGFLRYATYGGAMLAGAVTNSVFGLARSAVLVNAITGATLGSVAANTDRAINGYTTAQVLTYVWIGQALISAVYLFAWTELAERVRTGAITIDLTRPVDLQFSYLAADLGRALFALLTRGVIPLIVGALVTGLALPSDPLPYLLGAISVVLAIGISFAGRFAVSLLAFWLTEIRGVLGAYAGATSLLCGLIVPVTWFPPWLKTIAWATPFPMLLQVPADVLTARVTTSHALKLLALQVFWLLVTLLIGRLMLALATRKLVIQGG